MTSRRARKGPTWLVGPFRDVPERGAVSLELLALFTTAFLILFGAAQIALWLHARTVASSAAQLGVQSATVLEGDPAAGRQAAQEHMSSVGGVNSAHVTTSQSATEVTVTVTAQATPLVPFLPLPEIDAQASGTVERLTTP